MCVCVCVRVLVCRCVWVKEKNDHSFEIDLKKVNLNFLQTEIDQFIDFYRCEYISLYEWLVSINQSKWIFI